MAIEPAGPRRRAGRLWERTIRVAIGGALGLGLALGSVQAQTPSPAAEAATPPVVNSALDGPLLYQLLVAEWALNQGDSATAHDWTLDAARRTRDEALFRRATDIALQARAGERALATTRAWRIARPESLDALRMQLQILMVLGRGESLAEPLRVLLQQTPAAERPALVAALPRFLQRVGDPRRVVNLMEDSLRPYREDARTRVAVRVALGRAWLEAREAGRALELARQAHELERQAPGPALLALELMQTEGAAAEALVRSYLAQPGAEPAFRQAYVRVLTAAQRYAESIEQLELATRAAPDEPAAYLTLGALHLELRHLPQAEQALQTYLRLMDAAGPAAPFLALEPAEDDDDADAPGARAAGQDGRVQAWLMLAQAAEQRGDFAAAEGWLARVQDPARALDVQTRRAAILARQGRVQQARDLIRATPASRLPEQRARLLAEATVMRDARQWREAHEVLASANQQFGEDADLLYEQAMMAEKLDRLDEMERLLRRVMVLKPGNAHAYNALGYSLAERGQRLPEARQLIQRALELMPGDPFITDSLGWVEFRMGNLPEALRLLRQAYAARPDAEIGAHLGEVLWALGRQDEAREIWRQSRQRDATNEVLREALNRLRVEL